MIKINTKKAGERYLSIWMFINWFIILLAVVVGVVMFYSVKLDIRNIEANIMAERLSNCMSKNFDYTLISSPEFNIYEFCKLDKETIDSAAYYFNVSIRDSNTNTAYDITGGNRDFEVYCRYQALKGKAETNLAQCAERTLMIQDTKTRIVYSTSILAASNQKEEFS